MISLDILIALALITLTLPAVAHSYRSGGDACAHLHSITFQSDSGWDVIRPGWWAEIAIYTIIVGAILLSGPLFSGYDLAQEFWALPIMVAVYSVILLYVRRESQRKIARTLAEGTLSQFENPKEKMEASYKWYNLHATMVFTISLMLMFKLLGFFLHEYRRFRVDLAEFADQAALLAVQGAGTVSDAEAMALGGLKLEYDRISANILSQIEPFLVLSSAVILINVLLAATPLRRAFRESALTSSRWTTVGFVGMLTLFSLIGFFVEFDTLRGVFRALLDTTLARGTESLEAFIFLSAMLEDSNTQTGLSGFVRVFTAEGGSVVIAFAVLQWLAPKLFLHRQQVLET